MSFLNNGLSSKHGPVIAEDVLKTGICGKRREWRKNSPSHRRRLNTEEKAKVAAALGHKINSIPCCSSYFAPGSFGEKDDSFCSSNRPGAIPPILKSS